MWAGRLTAAYLTLTFWWRKVQMTTSQHQSTRSLHLQVYIGHSLYTVTAIYRHSPIYCHNSIYGIIFKPFRALCLEGASFCCFALYAPINYKLFNNEKIVWGSKRLKCFNWQYLRQRPINDKHVLRGTFFQDMSVKTPLQHTSCSNTKNGRPFARHVVFRAVWDKMWLLWVSRAALKLVLSWIESLLLPRLIAHHWITMFRLVGRESSEASSPTDGGDGDADLLMPSTLTYPTSNDRNFLSSGWFFFYKKKA